MSTNLILAQLLLVTMGILGVATSAPELIGKHLAQTLMGLVLTLFVGRLINPIKIIRLAPVIWLFTLFLLILTLFIGKTGNSSEVHRWLDFGGPFRFQPSEFAKLSMVLMLTYVFIRRGVDTKLFRPAAIIGITSLLVVVEPDLGTTLLIFFCGIFMMFMAGVRISNITKFLTMIVLLLIPVSGVYLQTHPYIPARIANYIKGLTITDPKTAENHLSSGGYQVDQAKKVISQGGLWGLGIDSRMPPVPADHTDMVVASINYSTGFVGFITMLLGFWLVIHSSYITVELLLRKEQNLPSELSGACAMASGAMFMIVAQSGVNLGVVIGWVPVTGVPLPMVSYGGSSQMAVSFAFGLIHSALRLIHREGWDVPEQEKPTLEYETLEHETLEHETLEPSILILEEFAPPRAEDEIFLPSA
jgi:cell division protein FtsW